MAISKNKGPLLTTKIRGGKDDFPKEFVALIGLDITSQKVPLDIGPSTVTNLLIESRLEQELTDERKLVNTFFTEFPTATLDSEVMLPSGLVAQRTRSLVPDPTDLVASVLTDSADQRNLGNGWLDQVVVEAPELFHEQLFSRERQILGAIPPEFRAGVTQLTTSEVVEGIAVDPGVLTGTIEYASEQQLTVFKKKVEQRGLDVSVIGTLTNYRMTPDQQLESLVVNLTDVPPSPSSFTAETVESEIKSLGGGLWLVTEGTVPDVFGRDTFSRERQILGAIPAEFRVGIQTLTTSHEEAGTASDPGPLTGTVESFTEKQLTEFKKLVEQRELDFSVLGSLTNYKMTREKQLESLTTVLTDVEPTPGSFSATTVESEIKALGGDLWLVTEGTVPDVFDNHLYAKERQSITPPEFAAILVTTEEEFTEPGSAGFPTLVTGDLRRSQQQVDEFTRRVSVRARDLAGIPQTLVDKRTNQYKQIETVTKIFELDTTTPAAPTALMDVVFRKLGDGTAVEERVAVSAVFNNVKYSVEIPDVVPMEFRALSPAISSTMTLPGDATPPVITDPNTLFASDEQLTVFTHRVSGTVRTLPTGVVTLTGHETTTEFGGGVLDVIRKLNTATDILASTGLFVISSVTRPLGNGMFYNETRQLRTDSQPWPTLVSRKYDEELQNFTTEETQVVDRSYVPQSGSNFVENIKALDKWRSQRIRITKAPQATSEASAIITYEYRPFQFPGTFDYSRLIQFNHHEGFRKSSAMLVKHTIKTWWTSSPSTPNILIDGEIIMDTVNIPLFYPDDVSRAVTFPNVLHDGFTTVVGAYYPPTTPTFTQYMLGTQTGQQTINTASLYSPGSGYSLNQNITISDSGHSMTVRVTALGVNNSILSWTQTSPGNWPIGTWGPFPPSGPPSTAQWYIVGYSQPNYDPSSRWVGNERAVAASVKKTDIPNLWKIQKVSVVMR